MNYYMGVINKYESNVESANGRKDRGCRIEHEAAVLYGLKVIYEK